LYLSACTITANTNNMFRASILLALVGYVVCQKSVQECEDMMQNYKKNMDSCRSICAANCVSSTSTNQNGMSGNGNGGGGPPMGGPTQMSSGGLPGMNDWQVGNCIRACKSSTQQLPPSGPPPRLPPGCPCACNDTVPKPSQTQKVTCEGLMCACVKTQQACLQLAASIDVCPIVTRLMSAPPPRPAGPPPPQGGPGGFGGPNGGSNVGVPSSGSNGGQSWPYPSNFQNMNGK